MYDVLIIGCGVTGAAAAFELSRYRLRVGIVERENDVALGTTKAMEIGPVQGAMSSIAICVCGIMTSVLALFL